jgi:polyisoprenyl-phosphate glycosyltransferase
VVDALGKMPESHRYTRGLVSWVGFPTSVVPFAVAPRAGGTSRFTALRLLGLAGDGVMSFSRLPLRIALAVGLTLLLLGVLDAGWVIVWLLVSGLGVRWELHALVTLDLVSTGFVLCGLGVVGEYVGRIYEQVKQRPLYLLKETSLVQTGSSRAGRSGHEPAQVEAEPPAERAA